MLKTKNLLFITLLSMVVSSCATTGYMQDRRHDAEDIFILGFGNGAGAAVRTGPLSISPLSIHYDKWIYRNGTALKIPSNPDGSLKNCNSSCGFLCFSWEQCCPKCCDFPDEMKTHLVAMNERGKLFVAKPLGETRSAAKDHHHSFPVPFVTLPCRGAETKAPSPAYYTQIEVRAGFVKSGRFGFNPGELVDFLFGWMTIDLFRDDLGQAGGMNPPQPSTTAFLEGS